MSGLWIYGLEFVFICAGDRGSAIARSVLNSYCNGTVQDAASHVLELERAVSAFKEDKRTCQLTMVEKEKKWKKAKSELTLQFSGEKGELQRSITEKELQLLAVGVERDAAAAELAHCRKMRLGVIRTEECDYQKHLELSKCEAERESYAAKLDAQKELLDRSPDENSQLGYCADSDTQQQTLVGRLEESLGKCRYVAQCYFSVHFFDEVCMAELQVGQLSIKEEYETVLSFNWK